MFRKWLYLLLATLFLCSQAYADARYGGISTRCLVKTNAEDYMYAGFQISGGAKTVTLGAYTISQIAGNNFLPRIEVKTFPDATLIYSDNNPNAKPSISTTLTLSEGWYTVTVSPVTQDGIGIVYVNEVDDTGAILASISTRCYVGTAAQDAMFAGVEVKGGEQCTSILGESVTQIVGNQFLPTLNVQTFPDGVSFTDAREIFKTLNPKLTPQLAQNQMLSQGPYTATVNPLRSAGIGIVAASAKTASECDTSTTQSKTDVNEPSEYDGMILTHNTWRQKTGVSVSDMPMLKWSDTLATYAQEWADYLKEKNNCKMEHRPRDKNSSYRQLYGENLASSGSISQTTYQLTPTRVASMWAAEIDNYNYADNSCEPGKMCGHYTQMVWESTTHIGCGRAHCGTQEIWVCNYNPPGNYTGQKPYSTPDISTQPTTTQVGNSEPINEASKTYVDSQTGLEWVAKGLHFGTRDEAISYCRNLNFDGHQDWRLSTSAELSEFVKALAKSSVKPDYFGSFDGCTAGITTDGYIALTTDYVSFGEPLNFRGGASIRCVRTK